MLIASSRRNVPYHGRYRTGHRRDCHCTGFPGHRRIVPYNGPHTDPHTGLRTGLGRPSVNVSCT